MKWKSWKFGRLTTALPRANISEGSGEGWEVIDSPFSRDFCVRNPSRTIPETVKAVLADPRHFFVKKRRDWDLLKISRLLAGEFFPALPTRLLRLRDAWVHLPSGSVISSAREVVEPCCIAPGCLAQGHSSVAWEEAPWLEGRCFLLATAWGNNFAHWLMDSLPRLSGISGLEHTKLLLGSGGPPFQEESLALLGFSPSDLVRPKVELVRCRELLVHCVAKSSGLPHPTALHQIRDRILHANKPASVKHHRRLYISRQSTRRKIVNHRPVENVLNDFGFETLVPENMNFPDQVAAFSEAEVVFGVHGAGTMNTLFQRQNACLIEAFNPLVWDHAAHRVASACDVRHFHLFGKNVGRAFDIELESDSLRKTLSLALEPDPNIHSCLLEKNF